MMNFTLYKVHDETGCETLLNVTRYLHYIGHDFRPNFIIEKNFPKEIKTLPTIYVHNVGIVEGIDHIISFYEKLLNMDNLKSKADEFIKKYPDYRISDKSTQKQFLAK